MSFIVSLQGGMASGKTAVAHYIEKHMPDVTVSYENRSSLLASVTSQGINKFMLDGFIQIQRLFIQAEKERYNGLRGKGRVVFDQGPEEVEFYTLYFPQSIGMAWDMERLLAKELAGLRECRLDGILFFDARSETLRHRCEAIPARNRSFFEHYMMHMHRLKKEWFLKSEISTFLQVDGKSEEEVGKAAVKWLKGFEN